MKRISLICRSLILAVVPLLFFCVEMPEKNVEDPDNAGVAFFTEKGKADIGVIHVHTGDSSNIGLSMMYQEHFHKVNVSMSCGDYEEEFIPDSTVWFDTVYFTAVFAATGPCTVFVKARYKDTDLKDKGDTLAFHVFPGDPSVEFTTLPALAATHTGRCDTLLFVTKIINGPEPSYTLTSTPEIDTAELRTLYSAEKDSVLVIFNPSNAGTYTVSLIAALKADGGAIEAKDTAIAEIRVFDDIAPTTAEAPQVLITGTADTLVFTADNESRSDKLSLQFITSTDQPLDTALFTILPSGSDSVLIAVNQTSTAATGTVDIGIAASNGTMSDTSWYPVTFVAEDSAHKDTAAADAEAPEITTQPADSVAVNEGETLTLDVVATGAPAPTYKWYKNDSALDGKTSAELNISKVTEDDGGVYHVVVSNGVGAGVASTKATVTIRLKAIITEGPLSVPVNEGDSATFTVKAAGEGPLAYQWLKDSSEISGATAATYTIRSVAITDSGKKFSCVVGNAFSNDTSTEALLRVVATPVHTVTFELDNGTPAVAVQRVKNGEKATKPMVDPAKTGFNFIGWYTSGTFETEFDFTATITDDITIHAKWEARTCSVTYHDNSSTSGSVPLSTTSHIGKQIIVASSGTLIKTGYSFFSWNTDSAGKGIDYKPGDTLKTGESDVHFYARWAINIYEITFNTQGGSSVAGKSVEHGDTVIPPTSPVKKSYSFDGWFRDAECLQAWDLKTKITESVNLYAKWVIRDVDGNEYTEVKIGNQVWMVENLKTTRYRDGSEIPLVRGVNSESNFSSPGYCWFNDDSATNKKDYGALYNWYVVDTENHNVVAPDGWHVSTDAEWDTLVAYFGGIDIAGGQLKEKGSRHWNEPNAYAINSIGYKFSALPGGYRDSEGNYQSFGTLGVWWTSTDYDEWETWSHELTNDSVEIRNYVNFKYMFFSVRCVRDL